VVFAVFGIFLGGGFLKDHYMEITEEKQTTILKNGNLVGIYRDLKKYHTKKRY